MTKRDWLQKSTVAVMLSTSLLLFAEGGQAAAKTVDSQSSVKAGKIVQVATSLIGKDYKYGAVGPNSFGSAGLATYIYKQAGVTIDDTIAKLYKAGKSVSADNIQPGDLLFFSSNGKGAPAFMGIYIGNDQYIYSSQGEDAVVLKKVSDYTKKLLGARRILAEDTGTGTTPDPGQEEESNSSAIADKVIAAGKKYIGTPYEYGSSRANKKTMDCSEFTMWAYREGANIDMGNGGARSQANFVKSNGTYTTDINKLKKGDLVFFMAYKGYKESDYKGINVPKQSITHVGIYMGDDKLLHTFSKESGGVKITDFKNTHWEYRFIMGGRPY
ncbi:MULTISPECIES: C40 family peptidase [Brevibacillus]|uniref:C40 family peptidase n=1 Tax=Brevibacillus TaxID=55080 RepID=UPI00027165F5|nr:MULTISPECIES: NlpC/P60 family protein [Brevibacillus]EJL41619.1 cell wall-associated hydrolase, invasion-associated protein [Brevibacillus sp. CF112]MDN4095813.1 NlpC/P60 family protein [Brevibacillus agri]MED1826050.1 NlpC/P60 family protein [Brevibacillus agri]MED3500407.1 NlpC/P60 family protein [Brevibacillus agri]